MSALNRREKPLDRKAIENAQQFAGYNLLLAGAPRLGDLLFACPAIEYLRSSNAVGELTVLCFGYAAPILKGLTVNVKHIELPIGSWNLINKWRLVRAINRQNFDAALVLDGKRSMRKMLRATNIPLILVEASTELHKTEQHLRSMLQCFPTVGNCDELTNFVPSIKVTESARVRAFAKFHRVGRPRVAFHVGCQRINRKKLSYAEVNRTATKLWQVERFLELGQKLINRLGATIVMVGSGSSEQALAEEFVAKLGSKCINTVDWGDSMQTAALLQQTQALVASDGGILHLGTAVGLKTIAIWGPTPLEVFGPYGTPDRIRVLRKEVSCSPCKKRECDDKVCLSSISADEALAALDELIATDST